MIVGDADRAIVPMTIIRRTVQFGLSNYPELNRKHQKERSLEHLETKYGENGYLKLWLEDSPNVKAIKELRKMFASEAVFRPIFDELFREETLVPLVDERFKKDEKYRENQIRIVAAAPGTKILGLHVPQMKSIAKKIAKREDWREIVSDWKDGYPISPLSHDERSIWGLVLDYVDCPFSERKSLIEEFLKEVDNWAICDTFCCNSSSWVRKEISNGGAEKLWRFFVSLARKKKTFFRRAGIVLMMNHFLTDDTYERTLSEVDSLNLKEEEPYYVRMAVAWLLATSLAKHTDRTREFVKESSLPEDIVKLYVRKARESLITRNVPAL